MPAWQRGDYDEPEEPKPPKQHVPLTERAREFLIGLVWHPHEREERRHGRKEGDGE